MTDPVVVDANIAAKWVLEEDFTTAARALLRSVIRNGGVVVGPPLLRSEVTNAIYQNQRRGRITQDDADRALAAFLGLAVELRELPRLCENALAFAREHRLVATYDAQYAVLASTLGADFWTADRTLIRSLPRSFRWVRWIGDYPLDASRVDDT